MTELNYMWGNVYDKPAESQAEIVALRAERDRLRESLLVCVKDLETWPKSLALKHGSLGQAFAALGKQP